MFLNTSCHTNFYLMKIRVSLITHPICSFMRAPLTTHNTAEGGIMESETLVTDENDLTLWTADNDALLLGAIVLEKRARQSSGDVEEDWWDDIAALVANASAAQCYKRYMVLQQEDQLTSAPSLIATGNQWSEDDVRLLEEIVNAYRDADVFAPNWTVISNRFDGRSVTRSPYDCVHKWGELHPFIFTDGFGRVTAYCIYP